jgi:predicted nucleic acid-binding Zn ribbon protein
MPRYNYYCSSCEQVSLYHLSINEEPDACNLCHITGSLSKSFNKNTFVFDGNKTVTKEFLGNKTVTKEDKVGDLTNKYIEDNRKILEQQIKEAKKEEYDPS